MKFLDKEKLFEVKYIDNHILVAVKSGNLLTQPNNTNQKNLQDLLKDYLKKKYNKKSIFLHPIHRLDKEVSGLVLFARSSKALSRLNEQMREKKITRKYIAEVEGIFNTSDTKKQNTNRKKDSFQESKELKHYILHASHIAKVFDFHKKGSKLAHLSFKVIKEKKNTAIIEIELITGRYHQIRAQFSHILHPIVGDSKYLSKIKKDRIHLICACIEFIHPVTKEKCSFKIDCF